MCAGRGDPLIEERRRTGADPAKVGSISTLVDPRGPGLYDLEVSCADKTILGRGFRWSLGLGLSALVVLGCQDPRQKAATQEPAKKADGLNPQNTDPGDTKTNPDNPSTAAIPDIGTLPGGNSSGSTGPNDGADCKDKKPYDFSLIWIANSPEGTVSKIDTRTAKEVARYRTGPTVESNPSRTSVSLQGFVAVANRKGSVTVIAPRLGKCVDKNGDGKITTSSSAQDVLPWGEDECVLWHHDVNTTTQGEADTGGPRAVAWGLTEGEKDPCGDERSDLWVGYRDQPKQEVIIKKLSAKGELLDQVRVPNWEGNWGHGLYGGAIDPKGNFWGLGTRGTLIRVDAVTMQADRFDYDKGFEHIPYGVGIDRLGRVWTGGHKNAKLVYFDPKTESFHEVTAAPTEQGKRYRGIAVGDDDQIWVAVNNSCGLAHYDAKTKTWVNGLIALPNCSEPVGVGIDAQGKVWVVDKGSDRAYRVDPKDSSVVEVTGLKSPYSYSDMTGSGLRLVENPPV